MGSQGCLSLIPGSYRGEGPDLREGPESPPLRSGWGEGHRGRGGTLPYTTLCPKDLVSQHGSLLPLIPAVPES